MIEGKGLTMRFGNNTALDGVDVCFGDNKIYGLLGRNGAGKSTLLSVVTNRLLPTAGEVFIDGEPARENDRVLGRVYYMGEKTLLPDTATVAQLFRWTGDFYPGFDGEYAGQLADTFGLPEKKKLKNLSTGYLTIAKLITALASNAPYTLFDEPVLGLDANHREVFYRQLIESYSRQPRTILISTHLIEEVADIIEQVVIIKKGRILLDKPTENPAGSAGRGGQADGVYRIWQGGGGGRLLHREGRAECRHAGRAENRLHFGQGGGGPGAGRVRPGHAKAVHPADQRLKEENWP